MTKLEYLAFIFFVKRYFKLEVFIVSRLCFASWLFLLLDQSIVCVIDTSLGITTSQLAVEFKFVLFDVIVALTIITVNPNVNQFSRIIFIFREFDFASTLGGSKR